MFLRPSLTQSACRWIKKQVGIRVLDYGFIKQDKDKEIFATAMYMVAAAALHPDPDSLPDILKPFAGRDITENINIQVAEDKPDMTPAEAYEALRVKRSPFSFFGYIEWTGCRNCYFASTNMDWCAVDLRESFFRDLPTWKKPEGLRMWAKDAILVVCSSLKRPGNLVKKHMNEDLLTIVFFWLRAISQVCLVCHVFSCRTKICSR